MQLEKVLDYDVNEWDEILKKIQHSQIVKIIFGMPQSKSIADV